MDATLESLDKAGAGLYWPKSEAEVARFPAKSDGAARRLITRQFVYRFAERFKRPAALEAETRLPGFKAALRDYHSALWRWVHHWTPPEVPALLDKPDLIVRRIDGPSVHRTPLRSAFVLRNIYLFGRAIYASGFPAGQGFTLEHAKYAACLGPIAVQIGDDGFFDLVRQHRHGGSPLGKHYPRVQFHLFEAWIAAGLWHLSSRSEQMAALRRHFPNLPPLSTDAIFKAQKRLGLRWPVLGR